MATIRFGSDLLEVIDVEHKLPPELSDFIEYTQREIAKAFTVPVHLLHDRSAMMQAYERTEYMRRVLSKLIIEHTILVVHAVKIDPTPEV